MEVVGGGAMLEEVHHQGLRVASRAQLPILPCFLCMDENFTASFLYCCTPSPFRAIGQNKSFLL